ncbi:alpha/beta hydrolase [Desulfogranum mediterraneum]|uniref:alpha/beta hydrolase n=1 Tax=Desulfogranum mediterraneum TaxID=160661 RepID=UPI00040EA436|nr:alpha/beta hydrolase [Desulfogranum mediterraneum]
MQAPQTRSVQIPLLKSYPGRTTRGTLHGAGEQAVIFSNMDTDQQMEWEPIIAALRPKGYQLLSYNYLQYEEEQSRVLEDAIAFMGSAGAARIILIGASRGGVASVKVAAQAVKNDDIVGLAALSAPIEHDGSVFYASEELRTIAIPTLLINSESDEGAGDSRTMYELFSEPKELLFYPGDAHGTELFAANRSSLVEKLKSFIESVFAGC